MTPDRDDLLARARAWLTEDFDVETRRELEQLIDADDFASLAERFAGPLEFGTAGLRGLVGAGPGRMNAVVVARATAGLAQQIKETLPDAAERGVVIARDGRRMSPELARIAAEILAGHGVKVLWFEAPVPTPVAAFAGKHLNAAAIAVVTASHNPPEYNGFKVYGDSGHQIVPPQDERIRAIADGVASARELPRRDFDDAVRGGLVQVLGDELEEAYLKALDDQCLGSVPPPAQVTAVHTALHGVGDRWIHRALTRRGFTDVHRVAAQAEPNAAFPTVRFPNPEEAGALDLATDEARARGAELILANDPDADRLCVAVADAASSDGFRVLTGNQLGILLADWLLGERQRQGKLPDKPLVVTTIVSTSMLERVAAAYGARCDEVLTGFKWLWKKALELEPQGYRWVFGFEEALGYCVGPAVRDKDGVSAAQVALELAAALKAQGKTLLDRLEELTRQHGVYATSQVSTTLPGLEGAARIQQVMKQLRADPPGAIAGSRVTRARDLMDAAQTGGLPRSNVLTWWLEDDSRVIFRPSGTEPKLKAYLEVRQEVGAGEGALAEAERRARARLGELEAWVRQVVAPG